MPIVPNLDPDMLDQAVRHAQSINDEYLSHFQESIDGYVGRYLNRRQNGRQDDPTNARFEFIGLFLPEAAGGRPKWNISCDVTGPGEQIADGLQLSLEAHAKEARYQGLFERMVVDSCLLNGMVATFPEERTDARNLLGGGPLYAPISKRVDQERQFWDVTDSGADFYETAFRGHTIVTKRSNLTAEAGWDMEKVARLAEFSEDSKLSLKKEAKWADRDALEYQVVFVPGATAEDIRHLGYDVSEYERDLEEKPYLYNGWLFYISEGQYIKAPEPFFGPAMGPYVRFSGYPIPGTTYTGSTMTFTAGQQESLNRAERSLLQSEEDYKRVLGYASQDQAFADALSVAKSGEAVALPALYRDGQQLYQEFEFGGPSQTMFATVERRRQVLDRNMGLSDEQKGVSRSGATATASSIAATSGQNRLGWQVGKFYEGCNDIGYINAWYMFHDPLYARSLPQNKDKARFVEVTDDGIQAIPDAVFQGGVNPDDGFTFDDFMFTFDYASVRHKTDEVRRAEGMEKLTLLANIAPMMAQTPWVDWKSAMALAGDDMERMFDYVVLAQVAGAEAERQAEVVPARAAKLQTQFNLAAPQGRASGPEIAPQPAQPQPQGVSSGPIQSEAS